MGHGHALVMPGQIRSGQVKPKNSKGRQFDEYRVDFTCSRALDTDQIAL